MKHAIPIYKNQSTFIFMQSFSQVYELQTLEVFLNMVLQAQNLIDSYLSPYMSYDLCFPRSHSPTCDMQQSECHQE